MDSVLELNPYACKGFEMHSFKPGQCRECSLGWKQHKGVIDDAMCKKLYEDEQKRDEEQQAKAAAKAARENANTFENRYKRRQSNPVNEMSKDDWYCDEEGEGGARASAPLLDVDYEPEDDQFTMQVIEQGTTPTQQPLKGVKVRNLLEEFDEMNVTTPKTAVPSPDSFSSPPDSTDAPVELLDALSLRLQELNEQERNRKAAESSRKEADDYRQDLELVKIENEVLREELKDAHEALRRVEQDSKASNGDEQSQCSCGTGMSGGEEACVQTDAGRSSAGTSTVSKCVQSDAGQMRSVRSVYLEQNDQQEWRDEQGLTREEIASLMLDLTDATVKTLADRICKYYGEVHLAWDEYRKLDRERQGQLLAMLAERDSEIRALREREELLNWRVANSTHAQGNATQRRFECRGWGNSLDDEEPRGGLLLLGPISRLLRALPVSGPLKVANYAVGTSKEAMRCALYCFGFIQYYAQQQHQYHSSGSSSPESPTLDENPDRFADCNV